MKRIVGFLPKYVTEGFVTWNQIGRPRHAESVLH